MIDTYIITSDKMDARPLFPEDTEKDIYQPKTRFTSSRLQPLIVQVVDVWQHTILYLSYNGLLCLTHSVIISL